MPFADLPSEGGIYIFPFQSMPAPKGMRAIRFSVNSTDAVHVYSDAKYIWLQLRRDVPTEQDIGSPSFKSAFRLTQAQALAVAGELLTAASHHQNGTAPIKSSQENIVQQPSAKDDMPANRGKPWTTDEDKQLIKAFDAQTPIPQIAASHQRSTGSIQARLVRLGKISLYQLRTESNDLPHL